MKHRFLYIMALLLTLATGAWAQDPDPIDLTPSADGTVWTLSTMPEYDVELEVTYYTDEEVAEMEETAYTEGVELTDNGDGTWTLAKMPAYDVELEVEYDDESTAIISIKGGKVDSVTYYDLSGRPLNGKPSKAGIYIKGGKKIVNK
ncbi:MAG: hypothetical protein J5932_06110 [Prevotella sp.]|nr:hypothetical protein [Prevotella sp.]